jgi:hypothetical protein
MAEFILVTRFDSGVQALVNTDEILRVNQSVDDTDEVHTDLILRNSLSALRIRENVSQLMMLLATPVGRNYSPATSFPGSFGPVAVPMNQPRF